MPRRRSTLLDRQAAADSARGWLIGLREDSHALTVRALLALGRLDEARAVAEPQLAAARAREAARRRGRAPAGARRAGRGGRAPLAAPVRARRRDGRSSASRCAARAAAPTPAIPLREARDLAHRSGATALEQRVHEELVVAGARPQRLAFSGVDALTASERRVAELAVRGLRNREIAETLFVSLKTVEVHLGRAYTKLGIKGRSQLEAALAT